MFTYSDFVNQFTANRSHMANAVAAEIARDAKARLLARYAAGYGKTPLAFNDFIDRIEDAVAGAKIKAKGYC